MSEDSGKEVLVGETPSETRDGFITLAPLDGVAALVAAGRTAMCKRKGERDTEFVKRIVSAYMTAHAEMNPDVADRAYANGMRAVLRAVWPHVSDSEFHPKDRHLAASLKRMDETADRMLAEVREYRRAMKPRVALRRLA